MNLGNSRAAPGNEAISEAKKSRQWQRALALAARLCSKDSENLLSNIHKVSCSQDGRYLGLQGVSVSFLFCLCVYHTDTWTLGLRLLNGR